MEFAIATLLLALVAAITFAAVNDYQWMMRFGKVSAERNDLLMKPVIEADNKRREERRKAGIPEPDYILSSMGNALPAWPDPPAWSWSETITRKPRKRRHYRQVVY